MWTGTTLVVQHGRKIIHWVWWFRWLPTGMCHGGLIDSREFGAMFFSIGILVGGLEQLTHIFPYIGNFIIPTDEVHHFSGGVGQPPTGIFFMANIPGCSIAGWMNIPHKGIFLMLWGSKSHDYWLGSVRFGAVFSEVPSLYGASGSYEF